MLRNSDESFPWVSPFPDPEPIYSFSYFNLSKFNLWVFPGVYYGLDLLLFYFGFGCESLTGLSGVYSLIG